MKNKTMIFLTIGLFLFSCCKKNSIDINKLVQSENVTDEIYGYYLMGQTRDTSYIRILLSNSYDQRISNDLRFKGISICQSKIIALKKITGLKPPHPITYRPDSVNIMFYKSWYNKNKCRN